MWPYPTLLQRRSWLKYIFCFLLWHVSTSFLPGPLFTLHTFALIFFFPPLGADYNKFFRVFLFFIYLWQLGQLIYLRGAILRDGDMIRQTDKTSVDTGGQSSWDWYKETREQKQPEGQTNHFQQRRGDITGAGAGCYDHRIMASCLSTCPFLFSWHHIMSIKPMTQYLFLL